MNPNVLSFWTWKENIISINFSTEVNPGTLRGRLGPGLKDGVFKFAKLTSRAFLKTFGPTALEF